MVVQHYFAGLAAFGAAKFDAHAITGYIIILLTIVLTILAAVARAGRRTISRSATLILLTILQPVLAFVPRVDAPALSAAHVVNALLIFYIVLRLAIDKPASD